MSVLQACHQILKRALVIDASEKHGMIVLVPRAKRGQRKNSPSDLPAIEHDQIFQNKMILVQTMSMKQKLIACFWISIKTDEV